MVGNPYRWKVVIPQRENRNATAGCLLALLLFVPLFVKSFHISEGVALLFIVIYVSIIVPIGTGIISVKCILERLRMIKESPFYLMRIFANLFMKMELEVLNFVKELGVGIRHPHSDFYEEGNAACQPLKAYGLCDFDDENFYHQPFSRFSCHIPGCERTFETVIEYESHYNSCHCYTCKECNKNLPNYHLLDLHISETHDSFFMAQAKKKPMYKCFLEECKECFNNPNERKDHCVKMHKFPSDFRFDSARKIVGNKKKSKKKVDQNSAKKINSQEQMDVDGTSEKSHEVSKNKSKDNEKKPAEFKGFTFGRGQGRRKPVFYNFSKDLMNSLPDS